MTTVKTTAELRAAIEAGADPLTIEIAAAAPVDTDALKAEAAAAAVAAERERIKGITALAATGFEAEINAAIETGASIEATALSLLKAAQDRGITVAAIKHDAPAAAAPATPPASTQPNATSLWERTMKKIGA